MRIQPQDKEGTANTALIINRGQPTRNDLKTIHPRCVLNSTTNQMYSTFSLNAKQLHVSAIGYSHIRAVYNNKIQNTIYVSVCDLKPRKREYFHVTYIHVDWLMTAVLYRRNM